MLRLPLRHLTVVSEGIPHRDKFQKMSSVFCFLASFKSKTKKVAINDVLPLKAVRGHAIANLKSFWAPGHQRLNFDGFIYIHYAAPPYSAGVITRVYGDG